MSSLSTERKRAWRKAHPEYARQQDRKQRKKWRRENPEAVRALNEKKKRKRFEAKGLGARISQFWW